MAAKEFGTEEWSVLTSARSVLAYMRRSSTEESLFTLSAGVGMVYGSPRGPLRSDRDLVAYALDIANGDSNRAPIERAIREQRVAVERQGASGRLSPEAQRVLDQKLIGDARESWRHFLETVMRERRRAANEVLRDTTWMRHVWPIPEVRRTESSVEVRYHQVLPDMPAFDAYARLLIVSDEFSRDLCRCRLATCGRFFLLKRTAGRPQRLYCDEGGPGVHMRDAHALGSTKRAQKSRARVLPKARRRK